MMCDSGAMVVGGTLTPSSERPDVSGFVTEKILEYRFERLFSVNLLFRSGAHRRVTRLRRAAIKNRAAQRGMKFSVVVDLHCLIILRQIIAQRIRRDALGGGKRPMVLALLVALSGHSYREYQRFSSVVEDPLLYISRADLKNRIYRMIRQPERDDQPLTQKSRFYRRMKAIDLPHPEFYGELEAETPGAFRFPRGSFLAKPINGKGGSGIHIFRYDVQQETFVLDDASQTPVSTEDIFRRLQARDAGTRYVIQELLRAHPGLTEFASGALPTTRVLTAVDARGEFSAIAAAFRMATRPFVGVDNFHKGGLAAPIDMSTGRLGTAISLKSQDCLTHHPLTRTKIDGFLLPEWDAVIGLALSAHRFFDKHRFVGWDIGITDRGPVIIEGNAQPDPDIHQRAEGCALGEGQLPEIALSWLEISNS